MHDLAIDRPKSGMLRAIGTAFKFRADGLGLI